MKTSNFIIFYAIFFVIYGLINYYIFIRGLRSIPSGSPIRIYYIILFGIFALSFFIGRTLENYWLNPISKAFVWIGSFWFGAMLYFVLGILIIDLSHLLNKIFPFCPKSISKGNIALILSAIVFLLLFFGYLNAINPYVCKIHLKIPKLTGNRDKLNIVAVSDVHLGTIIGKKRLNELVLSINALKPDIVLLPGDIVDEDLTPVIKENLGESLRNIVTKYGLFAITGNHEYIGGVENACKYLIQNNVQVLRDSSTIVNNSVVLIGREDRSAFRFTGRARKSLRELLEPVDKKYPVIVLDHQPFQLEESFENKVDLQISGHTHHGQLFPLNLITKLIYSLSWGYTKRGCTHYYVSCGYGTWGPPVRIGNRPEILNIIIDFR